MYLHYLCYFKMILMASLVTTCPLQQVCELHIPDLAQPAIVGMKARLPDLTPGTVGLYTCL